MYTGTYKVFTYAPFRLVVRICFYGFFFCCVQDAIRFSYVTKIGVHCVHLPIQLFKIGKGKSLLGCCPCFILCTYYIAFKGDSQYTISPKSAICFCVFCRFLWRYFYDILYLLLLYLLNREVFSYANKLQQVIECI